MDLFQKDNHASDAPSYTPAHPLDTKLVHTLLRLYYPHVPPAEVFTIGKININAKNFRVGRYYVKLVPATPGSALILQVPLLQKLMQSKGIPVAEFVTSSTKEFVITVPAEGEQGALYMYVQHFIHAHFYTGIQTELEIGFELLKKQKDLFSSLSTGDWPKKPYLSWRPQALLAEIENMQSDGGTFDTDVRAALPNLHVIADLFTRMRPALAFNECHHFDLHPHNLLFDDTGLRCVLDLESVVVVPYEIATTFNCFKLARKTVAMGYLPLKDMHTMVARYFDVATLYPFAQFELLRRITVILQLHYKEHNTKWDQDLHKHLAGLKEVEKLFGPHFI